MCQYCEFQGSALNKEDRKRADLLSGSHDRLELFLNSTIDRDDEWHLFVVDNSEGESIDSIQIHYCPVCGRPLN